MPQNNNPQFFRKQSPSPAPTAQEATTYEPPIEVFPDTPSVEDDIVLSPRARMITDGMSIQDEKNIRSMQLFLMGLNEKLIAMQPIADAVLSGARPKLWREDIKTMLTNLDSMITQGKIE
jgi:hypothetical protein